MSILLQVIKEKLRANPKGLYVLFYTEMWELFGRFGITALLVLYFTNQFHLSDSHTFEIFSAFLALNFATPILGGFLADRYLGSKQAVILGAVIMIIGNACMVIPIKWLVFIGLGTVAVGSGFFLPSIPPLVGALYEKDETKRDAGFTLYYIGKNIGALLAPVACGFIGQWFGINYAFILSTLGMISGLVVFLLGQKHLPVYNQASKLVDPKRRLIGLTKQQWVYVLAAVMIPAVVAIIVGNLDGPLLLIAGAVVAVILINLLMKRSAEERRHIIALLIAIFFVIVFCAFLGQGGTTLNLFIERNLNRQLFGITFPPGFFYALDPVFMLIMGPILAGFWMRLAKRGKEPFVTTKFAIALALLALGFLVFAWAAQSAIAHQGKASMLFVVLAYFLFPIAELSIMPISLSLVTKMAPQGLSALMVGIWLLANAASTYFTGIISKYGQVNVNWHTTTGLKQAARVYSHLFVGTGGVLIGAAVLIFVLGPLVKRLVAQSELVKLSP